MKNLPHKQLWIGWLLCWLVLCLASGGEFVINAAATLIGAALFYTIQMMRSMRPKYLRADLFNSVRMAPGVQVPTTRPWLGVVCRHRNHNRSYTRIDSTEGSGWMSDSYNGTVCMDCGRIIYEKKVY